jgi:hypothetical protein
MTPGTTGEAFDSADCISSTEYNCIYAATAQEVTGNPKSLNEVQAHADWPRWKEAMDHELTTLEKAGTWETVLRPPNKNIVGSKWVYRIKHKADGSIEKYKAHLVARGFTQVYVDLDVFACHES